ncbi:MAG: glycoside hydrolase family 13 protein [Bacteroidales bacterium]|nr:glycoside hydrolase family 13 protein [Bacteroidales bacterium]
MKNFITGFIITLAFTSIAMAKYTVGHFEPPFWWTGMKYSELQLLVYGPNISDLKPVINYPGVTLKEVIRVQSPNYLFINIQIHEDALPGSFSIDFKSLARTEVSHIYTLYERENNSAERAGFNNTDVIYLITPDRFANGNPGNDTIRGYGDKLDRSDPQARHGGDLQGVIDHLDYISDMGFTSIWLNPVLENRMPRTSYHGYAITDFYQVDPRYGSNEDYKNLGKLCREKGIKLIMDMVMNHCGSQHWWMKDMPQEDWINFSGKYVGTNHLRSSVQDPYAPSSEKELFHTGWFVTAMPDMNQKNELMAAYLIQNSIWWIEYAHLQGIRHDTHSYPDKDFMSDWSCAILSEYPNFNIVGEEWSPNPAIVSYWQRGKVNPDGYTSCMPSMMDFPTQFTLVEGLNEPESWGKGFIKMYEMLANDFLYANPFSLVIFPDNHDISRFYTQVNENLDLFKMGLAYILTMRGIPQIYYGMEILMSNPGTDAHGVIRSDFPGGWKNDPVNAFTGGGLSKEQSEIKDYLKTLLNWRKNKGCVHEGKLLHYNPLNGIYVYFRFNKEQTVMVILNKNQESKKLETDRFREVVKGKTTGTDVVGGNIFDLSNLMVPARSALILELN